LASASPNGGIAAILSASANVVSVANVMVFLASDYASYLTGEVISVSSQHA
jgi:enoyl-[acyl-carrier-protein] reductase (NADH)